MRGSSRLNSRSMLFGLGLTGVAVLGFGGWTFAAGGQEDVKTTPVLTTDSADLKWVDIPDLPPGAKVALLAMSGDWSVARVKFPPHYVVPPHSHPNAEAVWLISGQVGFGFGDKVDKTGPWLKPGAFFVLQPGGKHYVWTGDEGGVIDVQVSAPGGITFVDPADAPKKK
jgi:quercetin dioxygenase-like cupin family protein